MSFIETIEIKNFKSIRHQKIEGCKRINLFVGPPNVGKSNILEGLGLYSFTQNYNGEKFSFESICRFNHFSDLNYDKDIENTIHIGINKRYELLIEKKHKDTFFELSIKDYQKKPDFFTYVAYKEIGKAFTSPIDKIEVDDNSVYSIKYYTFDKNSAFDKVKSKSLSIPNGDNLLDILQGDSELRKTYNDLLSIYGLRLNVSDTEIAVAKVLKDGTFVSFRNNMVADTLRRLFFYLAAINTNQNSVLLFEEPEAHCYEPYILEITNAIKKDKNSNQFFIVTHSQYVVEELLKDKESRDDTNVYLVGLDNGETKVKLLSPEKSKDVYQSGLNVFFNYQSLWDEN